MRLLGVYLQLSDDIILFIFSHLVSGVFAEEADGKHYINKVYFVPLGFLSRCHAQIVLKLLERRID